MQKPDLQTTCPRTLRLPVLHISDAEIKTEMDWLDQQWDELRASLEESGGASGSPGEWIYERQDELETEAKRRAELNVT